MSRVSPHQLTARQVSALKDGSLADGGGLWLVAQGEAKSWYFRFTSPVTGKRREMGLGSVAYITLADARRRATEAWHQMADGLDPIDERRRQKAQDRKETGITFAEVAQRHIKEMTPGWRDPRAATCMKPYRCATGGLAIWFSPARGEAARYQTWRCPRPCTWRPAPRT